MNASSEISITLPPRVGRYRVTGLLGRGAMGVVYVMNYRLRSPV